MCVTCGCSDNAQVTITNSQTGKTKLVETEHNTTHTHTLSDGTVITHSHHEDSHSLSSPSKVSQIHAQMHGRKISLEQDILKKNNLIAAQNRNWFQARNILALNLVSSPGAGKTTL